MTPKAGDLVVLAKFYGLGTTPMRVLEVREFGGVLYLRVQDQFGRALSARADRATLCQEEAR